MLWGKMPLSALIERPADPVSNISGSVTASLPIAVGGVYAEPVVTLP